MAFTPLVPDGKSPGDQLISTNVALSELQAQIDALATASGLISAGPGVFLQSGQGANVGGFTSTAVIASVIASGDAALAWGNVNTTAAFAADITSSGIGNEAWGSARADTQLSFIRAGGTAGAHASGFVQDGTIEINGQASWGHATATAGGVAETQGDGAFILGRAAGAGAIIRATNDDAYVFAGRLAAGEIAEATASRSIQFLKGSNTVSDSVNFGVVGSSIHLHAAGLPAAPANGDVWVAGGDVLIRSGGVSVTIAAAGLKKAGSGTFTENVNGGNAGGYANTGGASMVASGQGSTAIGDVGDFGTATASGNGSMVSVFSDGGGTQLASGRGAHVLGIVQAGGTQQATNDGSFVLGGANGASGEQTSSNLGSGILGHADGDQLASERGALVLGHCDAGRTQQASGRGSIVLGRAETIDMIASASGAIQALEGTNATIHSFQIANVAMFTLDDKIGLFGVAAVVQPADASQAALGVVTTVGANTGAPQAGLSLIGDTSTVDQSAALMNDLASLRDDMAAAFTLINALRLAGVNLGAWKGAA